MISNNSIFDNAITEFNIYLAVEKHFGIELRDEEVVNITTIQELVELIKSKK